MSQPAQDNGVYYFLGNITSHILHALHLYEELGGTFIVLSNKAKKEVERYNVPVINLDNKPRQWTHFSRLVSKPTYHYQKIGTDLHKTTDFLNEKAKVVLFYELYDFAPEVRLTKPKTVFLTHGYMLKDYMGGSNRLDIIKQYDYMAALGPYLKQQFIKQGVMPSKLVDIGIARTDEAVASKGHTIISDELVQETGIDPQKKIISYMPTFWGPSSIYHTGKEIVSNFPSEYTLLLRPHPQTPKKLINEYLAITATKPGNVIYAPEGRYSSVGLLDIYRASSAIIGDISSVMLEAILTEKPLLFAYDVGVYSQGTSEYTPIREVVDFSQKITLDTAHDIPKLLNSAFNSGIDPVVWKSTISNTFFHANGTSVKNIRDFVNSLN